MKNLILASLLLASFQTFAAIGCLPGDCCNGHSCSNPPSTPAPRPTPRPPGCSNAFTPTAKRMVDSCESCFEKEMCAQYSNFLGEVVGFSCEASASI